MEFKDFNVKDIGTKLDIQGVVYGNGEKSIIIMLPDLKITSLIVDQINPTSEEWNQIIRQSDLLEVEVVDGDKNKKIILRKSTRQIDARVSWEVFRRDGYTCAYCGDKHSPLTVDHVVLWEEGGPSVPENLITACKKCNHTRGNMQFEDWIKSDYFLKTPNKNVHLIEYFLDKIPYIKSHLMRINKRNR